MKTFNLVKSLTRVMNNHKGLLILCLSLAMLGTGEVWGAKHTSGAVAVPSNGGEVAMSEQGDNMTAWGPTAELSISTSMFHINAKYRFHARAKDGYKFIGWYKEAACTTQIGTSLTYDENNCDKTYYAKFTPISYNITYNGVPSGVSNPNPSTYNIESETITFSSLTRTGYTFKGWNPVSITKGSTGDKSTTASWTANSYTVTFDAGANSAASPTSKSVTFDSPYSELATTTRAGLEGWYTDKTDGSKVETTTTVTTADNHTLYARYNYYAKATSLAVSNVEGDAGGGTYISINGGTPSGSSSYIETEDKSTKTIVSYNENPTTASYFAAQAKTGFKFMGWYSDKEHTQLVSSDAVYQPTITVTSNNSNSPTTLSLYAYFEVQWPTYYGKAFSYSVESKTGYTWISMRGTTFDGKFTNDISDDSHQEGKYASAPSFPCVFYAGPKDGYAFAGWYDNAECTGTPLSTSTANWCNYNEDLTATSTEENNPTTIHRYAKFVPVTVSEATAQTVNFTVQTQTQTATLTFAVTNADAKADFNDPVVTSGDAGWTITGWDYANNAVTVILSFTATENTTTLGDHTATVTLTAKSGKSATGTVTAHVAMTPAYTCTIADGYLVDDTAIDLNTLWTSTSNGTKHYSIVSFTESGINNDGATAPALNETTLSLGQAGTVKLKMTQDAGTSSVAGTEQTKTLTINKRNNTLYANGSTSFNPTMVMDGTQAIALTATNTDYSGSPITATQTAGNTIAVLNAEQTQVASNHYLGTATWSLSQPENYKYKAGSSSFSVTVAKAGEATDCYVLNETNEHSNVTKISSTSGVYGDPLLINGPADQLTFDIKYEGSVLAALYLYVQYSIDGGNNYENVNTEAIEERPSNYKGFGPYTLDSRTTHVRFFSAVGTTNTVKYKNIRVTRKTYLEAPEVVLPTAERPNAQVTGKLVINWSCASGGDLKIKNDNPKFTLGQTTITDVDCKTGSTTISITYSSAEVGTDVAHLVIYNDVYRTETTITGKTEKLTPVITWEPDEETFNVGDILTASSNSPGAVTLSVADEYASCVSIDGNLATITAVPGTEDGKLTITATVAEDQDYGSKSEGKTITVTNKTKQYITWNQSFGNIKTTDAAITLAAGVASGLPCRYTCDDTNETVVKLQQNEGTWTLQIVGEGEANITAYQDGNENYAAASSVTKHVLVYDPTKPCPTGGTLLSGTETVKNNDSRYYSVSCPKSLTFSEKCSNGLVVANLFVYQKVNGEWKKLYEQSSRSTSYKTFTLTTDNGLDVHATEIEFRTGANYGHDIKEISYLRETHATPTAADSYTMNTMPGQTDTETFTIDYSNSRLLLSFENTDNTAFSASPSTVGDCGMPGVETVTITYAPKQGGSETNTLYIKTHTGDLVKSIALSGTATKISQQITKTSLENKKSFVTTDAYELQPEADSKLTEFVYTASPEDVAEFTGNVMTFKKNCDNLSITITQPGNAGYEPCSVTVSDIVVSKVTPTIVALPTVATDIHYLDILNGDQLSGGKATVTLHGEDGSEVAGHFEWVNKGKAVTDAAGEYTYGILFVPSDQGMYNTINSTLPVTVLRNAEPALAIENTSVYASNSRFTRTVNLSDLITTLPDGDEHPMSKDAFTYTVQSVDVSGHSGSLATTETGIIDADTKLFHATATGVYTLTATSPETDYYESTTRDFTITVDKATPAFTLQEPDGDHQKSLKVKEEAVIVLTNYDPDACSYTSSANIISYRQEGNTLVITAERSATESAQLTITQRETASTNAKTETFYFPISKKPNPWVITEPSTMLNVGASRQVFSGLASTADISASYTVEGIAELTTTGELKGTLTAKAEGSTTITITQQANDEYEAKTCTLQVTVNKCPNTLSFKIDGDIIAPEAILQRGYGEQFNLVIRSANDDYAHCPISLTSSDTKYATVAKVNDTTWTVTTQSEIGQTTLTASQSGNSQYVAPVDITLPIKVIKPNNHLPITYNSEYFDDGNFTVKKTANSSFSGTSLQLGNATWGGTNWDDKFIIIHFEGVPDKITFKHRTKSEISGIGGDRTEVEWFVQQDATNSFGTGTEDCKADDAKTAWYSSDPSGNDITETIQLNPDARWLKICYSGNYAGIISNIQISELKYLHDPEPATWDFGDGPIGAENSETIDISVEWCNIPELTVTNTDPTHFTVTPDKFAKPEAYGQQPIHITYDRTKDIGIHTATITVSNGDYTKTITVQGETTKKTPEIIWHPDIVATGFYIHAGTYPKGDIGYIAQLSNKGTLTYESTDASVFTKKRARFVLKEGEAKVTFSYAGDNEYNAVSDTKTIHVVATTTELQTMEWNQDLMLLTNGSGTVELTAQASSKGDIIYTSNNTEVVTVEGNILTITGEGEADITAKQAGGTINDKTYTPIEIVKHVLVRSAQPCVTYALSQLSEQTFAANGNNPLTYTLDGTPEATLTFSAYHEADQSTWATLKKYGPLVVQEKVAGLWRNIFNSTVNQGSYSNYSATVGEQATAIRIYTTDNITQHIKDIQLKRKPLVRTNISEVNGEAEVNSAYTKKIKVTYSSVQELSILTNGICRVNRMTLDNDCNSYGTDDFTFTFTPTEKNKRYKDTIIITDGQEEHTVKIPVSLTAKAAGQTILGFTSEPMTVLTTDDIAFKDSTLSGNPVYHTSSDSTVAYVDSNNKLVILKGGINGSVSITITAHCDATDAYDAAPDIAKTITINKAQPTISEQPTASIYYNRQLVVTQPTGGKAVSGETEVAGTFEWVEPTTVMNQMGNNTIPVKFTPAAEQADLFAETTANAVVTVEKAPQTIVWEQDLSQIMLNHTVTLQAKVTVLSPTSNTESMESESRTAQITYSADVSDNILTIEGHTITGKAIQEEITLTAHVDGNDYYAAATDVTQTVSVIGLHNWASTFPTDGDETTINEGEGIVNNNLLCLYVDDPLKDALQAEVNYVNIINENAYTITQNRHYMMSVEADVWMPFVAPFDIDAVSVIEAMDDSQLTGTKAEVLPTQTAANKAFIEFIRSRLQPDAFGNTTSDRLQKIITDYTQSHEKSALIDLVHYNGTNAATANYYLYEMDCPAEQTTWTITGNKIDFKWKPVVTGEDGILMKKGKAYMLQFPYCPWCSAEIHNSQWDYWTGKLILFSGSGSQSIDGTNRHGTIKDQQGSLHNAAILTGNNTMANMTLEQGTAFVYDNNPSSDNYDYFILNETSAATIRPAQAFVYADAVPSEPASAPARAAGQTRYETYLKGISRNGELLWDVREVHDEEPPIYTDIDEIRVEDMTGIVTVYSMTGQRIASCMADRINKQVPTGMYLIRDSQGRTAKTVIR